MLLILLPFFFIFYGPFIKRYNGCSRKELDQLGEMNRYLDRWGWLFLKYKSHVYWEMVVFARKIVVMFIAKFLTQRPLAAMPMQSTIAVVALYLQYRFQPYVDDCPTHRRGKWDSNANNRLEESFLVGELLLFVGQFIHGCMKSTSEDKALEQKDLDGKYPAAAFFASVFEWIGVLVLVGSMAYFLAVHLYHKYLKRQEKKSAKEAKQKVWVDNPLHKKEIGLQRLG